MISRTTPTLAAWSALTLVSAGCAHEPAAAVSRPRASARSHEVAPGEGANVALPGPQPLRVTLRAPARAAYDPESLGPAGYSLQIRVTNASSAVVPIGPLRASFTARRDGVLFPCEEHVGGSVKVREPSVLRPGESFAFERDVDCTMPLPGSYTLGVYLTTPATRDPRGEFAGDIRLEVEAGKQAPRAVPQHAGLFAMMTAGHETRPLAKAAWARGDYRVVLALINAGASPIAVGGGRLGFLVYKRGSDTPCAGEPAMFDEPETLSPGETKLVRLPVTCAPSEEGSYEIVGRFSVGREPGEIEIGRVDLRVTRDPSLFTPVPLDSSPSR